MSLNNPPMPPEVADFLDTLEQLLKDVRVVRYGLAVNGFSDLLDDDFSKLSNLKVE